MIAEFQDDNHTTIGHISLDAIAKAAGNRAMIFIEVQPCGRLFRHAAAATHLKVIDGTKQLAMVYREVRVIATGQTVIRIPSALMNYWKG